MTFSPSSTLCPPAPPDAAPWSTYGTEVGLLLASARRNPQGHDEGPHNESLHSVDWEFLLNAGRQHGVDSVLYHHLVHLGTEAVPSDVLDTLQTESEQLLAFNLHRFRVLLQIVDELRSEDISVLPIKGPLLALQYYGNLGFRRFVDLDLLVPGVDFTRATSILQTHGFAPFPARTPAAEQRALDAQLGLEYFRESDGVWVELHAALLNKTFPLSLSPDELWQRAESRRFGATTVPMLSTEDLLIYLCAHGTKHHWASLKWIGDVAAVCQSAEVNWEVLLKRARRLDGDRMLFVGLLLAGRLLDAPVPSRMLERAMRDRTAQRLVKHVEKNWLFTDRGRDRTPRWSQLRFFMRSRRRWSHQYPLLVHYVGLALSPTENDIAFLPLPSALSGLYYLLRPIRLLTEWLRGLSDPSGTPLARKENPSRATGPDSEANRPYSEKKERSGVSASV